MEFSKLFSFPNEFNTIVDSLKYIFCKILYESHVIPDFKNIYLIESNHLKRHLFFKIQNDFIYTPLPAFWDIQFRLAENPKWEGCPSRLDHEILDLIKNIYLHAENREKISIGYFQLRVLFQQLEKENNFGCSYCRLRTFEMNELGYPILFLNDFYIGFRENSVENLQKILKKHIEYCYLITKQSRSPDIQKSLIQIVQDVYYEHKKIYEKAIFNHQPLDPVTDQFKRKLENNLLKFMPFLSFKNIDFKEWFKSLFMFQLELNTTVSESLICREELCKKILFLLFYLFPEDLKDKDKSSVPCLLYNKSESQSFSMNPKTLYSYHPMLRGSIITNYIKKY